MPAPRPLRAQPQTAYARATEARRRSRAAVFQAPPRNRPHPPTEQGGGQATSDAIPAVPPDASADVAGIVHQFVPCRALGATPESRYNTCRGYTALGGLPPIGRLYQPDGRVHLQPDLDPVVWKFTDRPPSLPQTQSRHGPLPNASEDRRPRGRDAGAGCRRLRPDGKECHEEGVVRKLVPGAWCASGWLGSGLLPSVEGGSACSGRSRI
jgi:hypothetical protein